MKKECMKKVKMMLTALFLSGFLLLPNAASAQPRTFPGIMDEAFPPFRGQGPVTEGAAKTGGMIVGTAAGVVAGFPLGIAGAVIGSPFNRQREGAYAGFMMPTLTGQVIGQYAVGTAVWLPKKILFDAPRAFFDVISAEDQKYRK